MDGSVSFAREGAVAWVTLSSPARFNALARADWEALEAVLGAIVAEDGLGCVVMRGAGGRAFSTGLDMARFAAERGDPGQARSYSEATGRATGRLAALPVPTISMIEGYCMGSGVDIACHCDLRIAAADAIFRVSPGAIGLFLDRTFVDGLVRVVGRARALEIVLEGRTYDAGRARQIGLINHLVPVAALEGETVRLANRLAERRAAAGWRASMRGSDACRPPPARSPGMRAASTATSAPQAQ